MRALVTGSMGLLGTLLDAGYEAWALRDPRKKRNAVISLSFLVSQETPLLNGQGHQLLLKTGQGC